MRDPKSKSRGLGRGLSALMADVNVASDATGAGVSAKTERFLPIEQIQPNPDQPRKRFSEDELQGLADSIREKGVIQPLIVRRIDEADHYQIVAGERRWRASQLAQLHELPVIVRELSDSDVLEIAIIENIQREELNAIEEALGYRQLMDRFGHTQEQISKALSKSRSHIANLLRLLNLPEQIQDHVAAGRLSAGHARTLVGHPQDVELAEKIINEGLSVRQAEKLAKSGSDNPAARIKKRKLIAPDKDADTRALEADLTANLKMSVVVEHDPGTERGRVTIQYKSLEQLDELCQLLGGL
ncbi:ParB/RepB/Spo0J family partition protein [Poseidonocella sedimentorum]|uniref:Chromosome segregation DNA-binding protein n=1 Tax=Poseidonocella sedimentorum TaxID=871652 RepID=A0A1I6D6W0_9RHOB|nr:ParB/RepB/Spo0J family partition protein [Poseidonocella sedimentorum]SFR01042.1 chromosome segregation DNA-binding protein [Poseidonocella sedimentorum]